MIEAYTTDASIIDTTYNSFGNFLAYFDYPNNNDYLWAMQYFFSSTLQGFLENMDVNSDYSKGCVLYSSYGVSSPTVIYDLLFFTLTDGSFIR